MKTPALLVLGAPAKLTSRQLEIVAMVGGGLANREIAKLLAISIRTVENHIYQACTVVGVNDRAELAAALRK